MKKNLVEKIFLLIVFILFLGMTAKLFSVSNRDLSEYLEKRQTMLDNLSERSPNVEPVTHPLYIKECSDCHTVYSRGLLPERSWRLLMAADKLENHFEEYLEIEESARKIIEEYLIAGSVEKAEKYYISRKIQASLKDKDTPIRVSQVPYIRRQHRSIPEKYISDNAKVISLSQCSACHQRVDRGIFDEDEVYIPYSSLTTK